MAGTYLTRTPSSNGNKQIFTFSTWLKRSKLGVEMAFFTAGGDANVSGFFTIQFKADDALNVQYYEDAFYNITPNRKFRDTNGWMHIVIAVDTTQATASNRTKIYVNGVQETSFADAEYPNTNFNFDINETANPMQIGVRRNGSAALESYFDGCMSHVYFIDGTAYDASTFGSTDSTTGEWKINTSPSVTYGTNGFFIFKDNGAKTDQSGNSNNFSEEGTPGIVSNTQDNPSNVFATGNPLHRGSTLSDATFSNGNTTHEGTSSGGSYPYTFSTLAASSGKWYAEFKRVNGETMMGIGRGKAATYPGSDTYEYTYFNNGVLYSNDSSIGSYGS